jgi:hypothetical protein
MSSEQLRFELQRGAKIVCYQYCVSLWVITFGRSALADYAPAGESRVAKGLPWTLLTLVLGWWGIPWGPIFTVQSLMRNFKGGKDLSADFSAPMTRQAVPRPGLIPAAK